MRLPIYRRLDENFQLLGLNLKELVLVGIVFVGLGQFLSFWQYGRIVSIIVSLIVFLVLLFLNRKLEPKFIEKLIRYLQLPSVFGRKLWISQSEKNHE